MLGKYAFIILFITERPPNFSGKPPSDGLATIVWIHPGNFTTGNPNIWNPYTIVNRYGVIVVTLAYRLNIMGFFTSMDGEAPGNFGLLDQQAAFKWINSNIKLFGGNKEKICLMGYGAGAISIGLHLINLESRGLFTKAIMMSGNFLHPSAVRLPEEDETVLDDIADFFGCFRRPTSALLECLRRLDGLKLVEHTTNINWRPLIDKDLWNISTPFLEDFPKNYFEKDDFYKVPLLTGYTNMENILEYEEIFDNNYFGNSSDLSTLIEEIFNRDLQTPNETDDCLSNVKFITDTVLFFYGSSVPIKNADKIRKLITDFVTEKVLGSSIFLHSVYNSKFQPTFMYRFDTKPSTSAAISTIPEWISVPHLFDLIYVWGIPYWAQLPDQKEWDIRDKTTSDIIMSFWTNFAKFSIPTITTIYPIHWENFTNDNPGILIIDNTFNMSDPSKINYKSFDFWNNYYPEVINIAKQCCGLSSKSRAFRNCTSIQTFIIIFVIATGLG